MLEKEIKEEILSELGEPTVKVELDETAWKSIFRGAKRWFQGKKGVPGWAVATAMREIDLPADAELPLDVVLSGEGEGGLGCLATIGFFPDLVPADLMGPSGFRVGAISHSDYVQVLQQLEMTQRLFNGDREWEWDYARRKLLLTGHVTGLVLITYKKKIDHWQIQELTDRDEDFIYRRCMVEAKKRLGRIRGKYPSYPVAGGDMQMDADVLLAEATEDAEKLDEEIGDSQMPISMVVG